MRSLLSTALCALSDQFAHSTELNHLPGNGRSCRRDWRGSYPGRFRLSWRYRGSFLTGHIPQDILTLHAAERAAAGYLSQFNTLFGRQAPGIGGSPHLPTCLLAGIPKRFNVAPRDPAAWATAVDPSQIDALFAGELLR